MLFEHSQQQIQEHALINPLLALPDADPEAQ
jgi:hypothetical protein